MEDFFLISLNFCAQFTGAREGIEHGIVRFGLAAMFWGGLFGFALWRQLHDPSPREKLLAGGFGLGFGRELAMLAAGFLFALGIIDHSQLQQLSIPLHLLTDLTLLTVAAAYLVFFLGEKRQIRNYLIGSAVVLVTVYLITLPWWTGSIAGGAGRREAILVQRLLICTLLFFPPVLLFRSGRGWPAWVAGAALQLLFFSEFLEIPDLFFAGRYETIFAPVRHGFYLMAILLLGYIYLRHQAEERNQADQALRDSTELLQTILDAIPAPIFFKNSDGRYLGCNTAFEEYAGEPRGKIIGQTVQTLLPEELAKEHQEADLFLLDKGGKQIYEAQVQGTDGPLDVVVHKAVFRRGGSISGLVGTMLDISERKRAEEKVRQLAFYDPLTGLPNRRLFHDRLQQALAHAHRSGDRLALLFMDLDRFKDVNDTRGHSAGDQLLRGVTERLRSCVRESDTLARLGGDEFVLLLTTLNGDKGAVKVAQKILDLLASPFALEKEEIFIGASIGIVLFPTDGGDAETLLQRADMAMYAAKERGKNTYQLFSAEMHQEAVEKHEMAIGLRRALQDPGQLFLAYQPQVEFASGRLVGVEALARWQHPQWGAIAPARFIPVAEETGLIRPLGEWVLRTACAQNRAWQLAGRQPVPIGVNLSGQQLRQSDFPQLVGRILAETGLDPSLLELELTETTLMEAAGNVATALNALKELGVSLSIDDFGTGYSSLYYLKNFPIDRIKIDRSFVREMVVNSNDAAIIDSILAIARSLRLRVVAEGVETREQLEFLQERNCVEMQGFYFAKPMSAAEFDSLFEAGGQEPVNLIGTA